ncbi:hypothetical protein [Streptomyces alkaliphilus]|uniref:hypothetical protein n=1 Tax=Streptomyces alkaliphilus TaxID=1472722 RepID=UPI001E613321|nr:hypothetical protein [Streptomyces alkaliphilus]
MERLTRLGILPAVAGDWPWVECLRRLRETLGRISERQFALLAQDHWYRSGDIWRAAGCAEGPGPLARLDAAAPWYREHLRSRPAGTGPAGPHTGGGPPPPGPRHRG